MSKKIKQKNSKKSLRKIFIAAVVLICLIIFWFTPLLGGVWLISDLKPLPPRLITSKLSDSAANKIISDFQQLESTINQQSYLSSISDVCQTGQNNVKVSDGFANSCQLTVTNFYGVPDNFKQYAIKLNEQLATLEWNNIDKQGRESDVNSISFLLESYFDRYIGTEREATEEYKQRTGFDTIQYSLNNLPSVTYYTKSKKRVEIRFGEVDNKRNYILPSYSGIQHPVNSGFISHDDSTIQTTDTIVSRAQELNSNFIMAVAITDPYYSN